VTEDGRLVGQRSMKTLIEQGRESFSKRFMTFCQGLLEEGRKRRVRVRGLGIGAPGLIGPDGMVRVSPNMAPLDGFPLAATMQTALDVPVRVVNDANAIAVGEASWGAGRDFNSFLMVTLGTGVGGGLILDRKLWEGADGAAGEVGHVTVRPDGRPCGCGSRGCLEPYASGPGLVLSYREKVREHDDHMPAEDLPESGEQVAAAARRGDPFARQAFELAGRCLGQVMAAVANLLNLDGVVVGGGASANLELMMPAIRSEIDRRAFAVPGQRLQVVRALLDDRAGILGAARAVGEVAGGRESRE
jgi:glucokinase